ncbi:MAG: SET domain-containing protein-lysine N-methyltransferase [Maritimibacter sp.]|nr:SET domain-containing protein-lysine N-methyltransferase [Maritimibacter sp.]
MMMVRCYLAPSANEGLGVYAHADIAKGAVVWLFDARYDSVYFKDDLVHVPAHFRELLERYAFAHPTDPDMIVLDCDEGRFLNHAANPNLDMSNPNRGIATRKIRAGEELTWDCSQCTAAAVSFAPSRHRAHGGSQVRQ